MYSYPVCHSVPALYKGMYTMCILGGQKVKVAAAITEIGWSTVDASGALEID